MLNLNFGCIFDENAKAHQVGQNTGKLTKFLYQQFTSLYNLMPNTGILSVFRYFGQLGVLWCALLKGITPFSSEMDLNSDLAYKKIENGY